MADQDAIKRLLEVELEAEQLVKDAEIEAERRKTAVRQEQTLKYQEEGTRFSRESEALFQKELERIREERSRKLNEALGELQSIAITPERFSRTLDEIIRRGMA